MGARFPFEPARLKAALKARHALLAPRWLVTVDAQKTLHTYRLRTHLDGGNSLRVENIPSGERCWVVLDPNLPFRRKLQTFPQQSRAREILLRTAPDEFPLARESVLYSLGLRDGEGYLYAIDISLLDTLRERGIVPDITLVGDQPLLDEQTCLRAVACYEKLGAPLAFGHRRRPLPQRWLINMALASAAGLLLTVAALLATGHHPLASLLDDKLVQARAETAELSSQYLAANRMLDTHQELTAFGATPEARLPQMLEQLWGTMPDAHSIRRIEYKDGQLTLLGSGADAARWLESAGFAPEKIKIEMAGKLSRFKAEITLAPNR